MDPAFSGQALDLDVMTDPDLESELGPVLLAARLAGIAELEAISWRSAVDTDRCLAVLNFAEHRGEAEYRRGVLQGWRATSLGRTAGATWARSTLDRVGRRPQFEYHYQAFLALNADVLNVCSDWQVRSIDGVDEVNDHQDEAYDRWVLERFVALADRAHPVVRGFGAWLERYSRYANRLDVASRRVQAGDTEWLTRPTLDSYHTVWFELHEDLLCTLGRTRHGESSQPDAP